MAEVTSPRRAAGGLSEREREVLRLVAEGLPTKQIARNLSISERTVKFHVTSIFHKLGADNRAQAVALAAQRGLLT
jgi:DNA-binding CsgD family transcriptional regulator